MYGIEGKCQVDDGESANGVFPEVVQVVTEHNLLVNDFSPDGLTCTVADTYSAGYHLRYHDGQWEQVDIPEEGTLDGVMYLGTSVYE